jgi:DNA (cytosine-5)-methyltransferase 1
MAEITKVIRVFETFAGIGAQHKAISNIDLNFEVVGTSEWDARAIISYTLIHYKKKFIKKIKEVGH